MPGRAKSADTRKTGLPSDGLPDITGGWDNVSGPSKGRKLYSSITNIDFDRIQSSFGLALHMHQPTIPASSDDLRHAALISNLQHMLEHPSIGDNHNAAMFYWCYSRMYDFITEMVRQGQNPRIMLDYSGNLLFGLQQMGNGEVIDKLAAITCDKKYFRYVEWLGTMWSHAVVSSTPVPDIKLHILAWRKHFSSLFGQEALERVKGFSAPEMHIPIHPDVCYEYIKALKDCGYEWLMVQEHTIQNLDGTPIKRPHYPHRLEAKNSLGETEEITVLIKTQGSDTKLVAQMQPYAEARSRGREEFCGRKMPPFVLQIGDGENGGVMMNEFPQGYKLAFNGIGLVGVVALNGSEYLELLDSVGIDRKSYTPVQPIAQHRIWEHVTDYHHGACDESIKKIHEKDPNFNLDKGSWTNDKDWVKGYDDVMDPIIKLSVAFHKKFDSKKSDIESPKYKKALFYLLLSQTSCFRYWGQGLWTEYAKEICRRGMEALKD